jgi:hypothetical protein
MRVNARLEPEVAQKLSWLKAATGGSTSDVLRCAIDVYFEQSVGQQRLPYPALEKAGLLACADGPRDLSRTYKARLARSLRAKHGHR